LSPGKFLATHSSLSLWSFVNCKIVSTSYLLYGIECVGEPDDVLEVVGVVQREAACLLARHLEEDHHRTHVLHRQVDAEIP